MATITETCRCGAQISVTDDARAVYDTLKEAVKEWRTGHKCGNAPPGPFGAVVSESAPYTHFQEGEQYR